MVGNESAGEYHLEIVNTTLDDEAEYQCQVAPAADDQPLTGVAHLTVIGYIHTAAVTSLTQSMVTIRSPFCGYKTIAQ